MSVSKPLGVSERLIVSEQLKYKPEEHKPKEHELKEYKQLPKRSWLNIVELILAAPILNMVTCKILTKVIY